MTYLPFFVLKRKAKDLSSFTFTLHLPSHSSTIYRGVTDTRTAATSSILRHYIRIKTMADDLEWEEWDAQTSPLSFGHHCLAGSFAGVVSWATTHSFCCCGVAW